MLIRRGEDTAAIQLLRQAYAVLPRNGQIVNALAWYLSTSSHDELRDGLEAVSLLEPAKQAGTQLDATTLDTLAAAYAEAGRFDEAVATADEAIELAKQLQDNALAQRITSRRALYKEGQPFRAQ